MANIYIYILIAVAAVAIALGYGHYKDGQGYDRAAAEYTIKIQDIKLDLTSKHNAEIERIDKANNTAKQKEAEIIAQLEQDKTNLDNLVKELQLESEQDPTSNNDSLGASSVQRINRVR